MATSDLTAERLRELLDYNPDTGVFTHKVRKGKRAAGTIAGWSYGNGYLGITIDGVKYYAHRLAWFWVYGEFPTHDTDHIDMNKRNNAISNLRKATRSENQQNHKLPRKGNSSNLRGVSYVSNRGNWLAQITYNGKNHSLGRYPTKEQAHEAYLEAKRKYHPFGTI